MEQRVQPYGAAAEHALLGAAVQPPDPGRRVAAQELGREVAERADDARLHEVELRPQVLLAMLDLRGQRVAVARRPALEDVRDEDVGTRQPDLPEQALEQGA